MTELPAAVDVLLIAGALSTALAAIAAISVKAFEVVRRIDEHFRRRESERIEAAAGRLIDQAATALGSQLTDLGDRIERIDRRHAAQLADWELWRAGVDARLDLLDAGRRFPFAGDQVNASDPP